MTTIQALADFKPKARVRLYFKNTSGTGILETTAGHAVYPNQSQRFFPPQDKRAFEMGWPVPYWYATECVGFTVL